MKKRNALIVFAKNPVSGKVKTRLAESIGDQEALNLYKKLLSNTYLQTKNSVSDKYLFLSEKKDASLYDSSYIQFIQSGNDIGEKMKNAFDKIFKMNYCNIVLTGTDIPDLTTEIINLAFEALNENDFVIGPAFDGGYYLIGMKSFNEFVFENIEWSTDKVLLKTITDIKERSLNYFLLKELYDIDDIEDIEVMKLFLKK